MKGTCKLLRVYCNEADHHEHKPLYHGIVMTLKEKGIAGATVLRGIEGFGAYTPFTAAQFMDFTTGMPVIIEAVDEEEKISEVAPVIRGMVKRGLVLTLDVTVY